MGKNLFSMADRAMKGVSSDGLLLLRKVVQRWAPSLEHLLNRNDLTDDEREELRGALSEELVSSGLNRAACEPNAYGLRIEGVIDELGRVPEAGTGPSRQGGAE